MPSSYAVSFPFLLDGLNILDLWFSLQPNWVLSWSTYWSFYYLVNRFS